jgi:hypothetical protein
VPNSAEDLMPNSAEELVPFSAEIHTVPNSAEVSFCSIFCTLFARYFALNRLGS